MVIALETGNRVILLLDIQVHEITSTSFKVLSLSSVSLIWIGRRKGASKTALYNGRWWFIGSRIVLRW